MPRRRTTATAIAVVTILSGCGGSSSQDQVRAAFDNFHSALERRNARTACNEITTAFWQAFRQDLDVTLTRLGGPSLPQQCLAGLTQLFRVQGGRSSSATVTVSNVVVHGASATATAGGGSQLRFVHAGGSWRINCCVGAQLNRLPTQAFRVPSGSMEPTLHIGQIITSDNAAMRAHPPAIGDIIVFHPPRGADQANPVCGNQRQGAGFRQACDAPSAQESNQTFIKRVVAAPGDRVSIVEGLVVRNGVTQTNAYAKRCGGPDCNFPTPITIPAGEYFVLGDNRGASEDSRFWGPIKRAWIIGLVKP